MIGKLDELLQFHQTALRLRAERQQVLASNIANADTPNYKARDIDFNSAFKEALSRSEPVPGALAKTSAAHLAAVPGSTSTTASGALLQYRGNQQGNIDGNTVDMDVERNQFADNALRYEAGITFVSGQLKSLLAAIQGQ